MQALDPIGHAAGRDVPDLRHVLDHLRKDLRLEWRSRDSINGMLFFALLVVVVFGLAFDPVTRGGDEHAVALQVPRGQLGEARVVLHEKDFDGDQGFRHRDTINTSEAPGGNLHSLQRHSLK